MRLVLAMALVAATVLMGLIVSAPPSRADHDTISWSEGTLVAGKAGFTDYYANVVADGRGSVYVFYVTYSSVLGVANINVTKYAAVGPGGLPQFMFDKQVNSIANVVDPGLPFSATVDHSGALFVAWTRSVAGGDQIWLSRSTDGGVTWDSAVRVSGSASGSTNIWPVITATSGDLYVGWVQSWGGYAATVARSTDGGSTFSTPQNATAKQSYIWSVSIASDADGRVYLGSGSLPTGGSTFLLNVTWSDNGAEWSSPTTVSATTYSSFFPALYADPAGAVDLSWFSQEGSDYAIRYSRSVDRGATWTAPVVTIPSGYGGGSVGYMSGGGDTLMYAYGSGANAITFAVSGDRGASWYPAESSPLPTSSYFHFAADQNDTMWGAYDASNSVYLVRWAGPPSAPVIKGVSASGTGGLTVTWQPSPEQNVQEYRVYRSTDGSTYQIVAVVSASATSYTDTGLANGMYWYKIDAVNGDGTASHSSGAWPGTVGPTTAQLIATLQGQIAALQSQLNSLQGNTTALQKQINDLTTQLNNLQAQQATQTISYANLAFEIIVVVLLVVLLLNQMRRPRQPQMMMAQPGQATQPRHPEDEL